MEILPGNYLKYQKEFSPYFVEKCIEENSLCGLRVFFQLEKDRIDSFDFLKEYTFLEGLGIASKVDYNYEFLKSLTKLKRLTISTVGSFQIDLSNQANLEALCLQWRGNVVGIERCVKLNDLCLWDFSESDLKRISCLKNLKRLTVKTSLITSLAGISDLTSLEYLWLGNCKSLTAIKEVSDLHNVRELKIELCPKIEDFDFLSNLPNLECLELNDCRDIDSLKFIEKISSLRKLFLLGNTNISDSDLRPTKRVAKVKFVRRKNYYY